MGDQEIEMEVSSNDFEEDNSSQISQTVSTAANKKNIQDENGRSGKHSETGIGKKKKMPKHNAQKNQKDNELSSREMRKI